MSDEGSKIDLTGVKIGYVLSGSFCTFEKSFAAARRLRELGAELLPIMSFNASAVSTRFGTAKQNIDKLEAISGKKVICTLEDAEPIGPKKLCDIIVVAPCTATTLAKLALGIYDTPAVLAVKSSLRNGSPAVIAVSTNDALAGSSKNIGMLHNYRNYYFVPYSQDAPDKKPNSVVADFTLIPLTVKYALEGKQLQPMLRK